MHDQNEELPILLPGFRPAPTLLPRAEAKRIVKLIEEIVWLLDHGKGLDPDPIFRILCEEFKAHPRKDWAAQIEQYHAAHQVAGLYWSWTREISKPPPDFSKIVDEALDRDYQPANLDLDLAPDSIWETNLTGQNICWRWKTLWRELNLLRVSNRTQAAWSTGGAWDIRRVDLDAINADASLRWKPRVHLILSRGPTPRDARYDLVMEIHNR